MGEVVVTKKAWTKAFTGFCIYWGKRAGGEGRVGLHRLPVQCEKTNTTMELCLWWKTLAVLPVPCVRGNVSRGRRSKRIRTPAWSSQLKTNHAVTCQQGICVQQTSTPPQRGGIRNWLPQLSLKTSYVPKTQSTFKRDSLTSLSGMLSKGRNTTMA